MRVGLEGIGDIFCMMCICMMYMGVIRAIELTLGTLV